MKAQVLGEATSVRVTDRGKEACEDVRKRWVCSISLPRLFSTRPTGLGTETRYEADASGLIRRVAVAADQKAGPDDQADTDNMSTWTCPNFSTESIILCCSQGYRER